LAFSYSSFAIGPVFKTGLIFSPGVGFLPTKFSTPSVAVVEARNELGATACGCSLRACCSNGTERGSAARSSTECRTGAGNSMGFRTVERAAAHRAALRRHRNRFEQHALDTRTERKLLPLPAKRGEGWLVAPKPGEGGGEGFVLVNIGLLTPAP